MSLAAKNAKSAKKAWPMVRLGDVCEFVRRGKSPIYCETSPYPMFAQKCNQPNGIFLDKCKFCEPAKYLKFDKEYRLHDKDIVINSTGTGTLGRVGFFREEYLQAFNYESIVADSHVTIVRMNNQVLQEYLYLFMRQDFVYKWLNDVANGSTNQKELYPQHLVRLEFPLPPLPVQREIVARLEKELGEVDALAAKFKEIAENADAEFKAELDETFKNVEGEKVRLGDVCEFLTDGDWIESKDQSENGVRLIQTGNVGIGVFKAKESNAHYISEETFERLKCTEIFNGDVLVSRLPSPVGRACIVNGIEGRMITAVDCSIIRFKDVVVKEYFVAYSQTQGYQAAIDVLTTGTTRARISRKNLASIPVPLLPLSVQREIVTNLDVARERCDKLKLAAERGLRAAEDLRKAILAEAFE